MRLYATADDTLTKESIEEKLHQIAKETFNLNLVKNFKEYLQANHNFSTPTVSSPEQKTTEDVIAEFVGGIGMAVNALASELKQEVITKWLEDESTRLKKALENGSWKNEFQGKIIFNRICGEALKTDSVRVRQAYVDMAIEEKPEVFEDLAEILASFNSATPATITS